MSSRAAKLRSKRKAQIGRPLKQGVARTDSGQISRAQNPAEPSDKVAREARMRIFGVSEAVASTPQAATFMGRLSLLGQAGGGISVDQYDALVRFSMDRESYMRAIQAPDSLVNVGEGGRSTSDEEADAEARIRSKRRYLAAREAIQAAQNENRTSNLWAAVEHIVIKNMDFSHMIGDLRLVGNALDRHYRGLDRQRKSA
jgi:hypothetical protein